MEHPVIFVSPWIKEEDKQWLLNIYNLFKEPRLSEEKEKSLKTYFAFPPNKTTRAHIIKYDDKKEMHFSYEDTLGRIERNKTTIYESKD